MGARIVLSSVGVLGIMVSRSVPRSDGTVARGPSRPWYGEAAPMQRVGVAELADALG